MVPMPLNTKKQKDNQEAQNNPTPQIIRTQGPFTRLIQKRTGTKVRNGEDEKSNFRH
jgi:hypothetical protein